MAAFHIIGVDFKFGLGQKLTVVIQHQGLADLVAIGFLGPLFDKDLALEHADSAIFQHFLEHLPAFATLASMGYKHRVIMQESAVTDGGTCNMPLFYGIFAS